MKKLDENRIHVNLWKDDDGLYKITVSSTTQATRLLRLSCGSLLSPELSATSLITIEYCRLTPTEFEAWLLLQKVDKQECKERYCLSDDLTQRLLASASVSS